MTVTHPLAIAWLEHVERLAVDLPPGERTELLADLREHLDVALVDESDGAQVGAVLDRLGDPADVVAAARSHAGGASGATRQSATETDVDAPEGLTAQEVIALAALVLAGLVGIFLWPVTTLLWAVGIALVAVLVGLVLIILGTRSLAIAPRGRPRRS